MNTAQQIQSAPAVSAGFDVENLDNDELNQIEFKCSVVDDVDGESVSGFIIVGKNSQQYQDANHTIRSSNIKRASKRKTQIDASTDQGAELVSKTVSQNERSTALAVIVGWYGFTKAGVPMEFDKAVVEKMLAKFPQWQNKVIAALDVDANFMKV